MKTPSAQRASEIARNSLMFEDILPLKRLSIIINYSSVMYIILYFWCLILYYLTKPLRD